MDKKTAVKIAKDYVRFLNSHTSYKVAKAFLFGSSVKNRFRADSDIDIAIILKRYNDTLNGLANLMRLRRKFDLRIEPHHMDEKDFQINTPFTQEIRKGTKIL